jgi:hypothetical protein
MTPSAAADPPSVDVIRLGSSAVGTSCPTSARRLAVPIQATPGVNHRGRVAGVCPVSISASVTPTSLPGPAFERDPIRPPDPSGHQSIEGAGVATPTFA